MILNEYLFNQIRIYLFFILLDGIFQGLLVGDALKRDEVSLTIFYVVQSLAIDWCICSHYCSLHNSKCQGNLKVLRTSALSDYIICFKLNHPLHFSKYNSPYTEMILCFP